MIEILQASSEDLIEQTRAIFKEYADDLCIDLCFQNFTEELENLPGDYGPPNGCIYLAYYEDKLVGCVALRKFEGNICEMKRLYVRPRYRGKKIGKELSRAIIKKALEIGYTHMRLDTLDFMTEAITLYRSLGFKEIDTYRYNPLEGVKFFELDLEKID
jgi:GNAT superfamily N-acetyltransferase